MFFPPIGLHRISLVRASGKSSRTVVVETLEGKKVRCLLGEQTRRRLDLPRPAPPRRPAVCRPDPACPWYVRVLDSTSALTLMVVACGNLVILMGESPGHALHEKGLQRQKGAGPLVSSQERRALFIPLLKRGSNAGPTRALFLHRFT